MTGFNYNISLDDSSFDKGMTGLLKASQNLRPIMEIAGGIFENSTRHRFDTERGPGDIPWPPTWKQRVGAVGPFGPAKNSKTLQDKGLLRGSIISNVGDDFVETGVDGRSVSAKYAKTHQFGATIKPKAGVDLNFIGPSRGGRNFKGQGPVRDHAIARNKLVFVGPDGFFHMVDQVTIPARPFVGIDENDKADLRDAIVIYLEGASEA